MKKKNGIAAVTVLTLILLVQPVTVYAAGQGAEEKKTGESLAAQNETADEGGTENETADSLSTSHSLSSEELSALLDFVKEKWDAGELEGEDAIRKAIEEGEAQFGVVLQDSVKDQIADGMQKLDALGLDHDAVIGLAKKLYQEHGDKIAESFQEIYEEYADELTDSVEKAIARQVVEPAKEAAKAAVENTAKTFWQDLKNSVISFFRNIFS